MGDDELILCYHFGDLSPEERADFEERLAGDPALAQRLEKFRACFFAASGDADACLANPQRVEPPCQLARRTIDAVFGPAPDAVAPPSEPDSGGARPRGVAEIVAFGVAATLLLSLGLPTLLNGREVARRDACEGGLIEVYKGLAAYGDSHRGRFPKIGLGDNAGLFAVALAEGGYARREELERDLVCPSSDLARLVAEGRAKVEVPSRAALEASPSDVVSRLLRYMAGSYAYRIGHYEGDTYVYPRNRYDCRSALLADSAQRDASGAVVALDHGPCGQNVLFEDGHVAFVSGCWAPGGEDHLFLNDDGQVAAGRHSGDVVLAPSQATPGGAWFVTFGR